jgi:hypothetical protein
MKTTGRNITAEAAFDIAVNSLFDYGREISDTQRDQLWELCHASEPIQWATTKYLAATSPYAPTAFEKLKAVLAHYVAEHSI